MGQVTIGGITFNTKEIAEMQHNASMGASDMLVFGKAGTSKFTYMTKQEFENSIGGFIGSRLVGTVDNTYTTYFDDTAIYTNYNSAQVNVYLVTTTGDYRAFVRLTGDLRFIISLAVIEANDVMFIRNTDGSWAVDIKPKVPGPTGPAGPTGPTGPVGPTGPTGATGSPSQYYLSNNNIYNSLTVSPDVQFKNAGGYVGYNIVNENDFILSRLYGIQKTIEFDGNIYAGYDPSFRYSIEFMHNVPAYQNKKYSYAATIVRTNDPGYASKLKYERYTGISPVPDKDTGLLDISPDPLAAEKTFILWGVTIANNQVGDILHSLYVDNMNASYTYKISGFAYWDSDTLITPDKMFIPVYGSDRLFLFADKIAAEMDVNRPIIKMDRLRDNKMMHVYGTSIDDMVDGGGTGTTIWDYLAKLMQMEVSNHALSGSKVVWDTTLLPGFDYVNSTNTSPQDKCLSASAAERSTFMSSVNREASRRNDPKDIALSYDNSMANIQEGDIVIFSTYAANDAATLPPQVEAAVKAMFADSSFRLLPNKKKIMELSTVVDLYDRTNFFGAMNFCIQQVRKRQPKAPIFIMGLTNYAWLQYTQNDILRIVADLWCIPFIGWADEMGQSQMIVNPGETANALISGFDDVHPWQPQNRQRIANYAWHKMQQYL